MPTPEWWTAPDGYGWVSCNVREYGAAGLRIHLIRNTERANAYWQTTVCGATANQHGIWRRPAYNSRKPVCDECLAISRRLRNGLPE